MGEEEDEIVLEEEEDTGPLPVDDSFSYDVRGSSSAVDVSDLQVEEVRVTMVTKIVTKILPWLPKCYHA